MKISVNEFFEKYYNAKSGEFELPEEKQIIVKTPVEIVLRMIEPFRLESFLGKAEIEEL